MNFYEKRKGNNYMNRRNFYGANKLGYPLAIHWLLILKNIT